MAEQDQKQIKEMEGATGLVVKNHYITMEQEKKKIPYATLHKIVNLYKDLKNREIKKKRTLENEVYWYLQKKLNWETAAEHIYSYIFHKYVPAAAPLYKKAKERIDKKRAEDKAYDENLVEIAETLKVGDVIVDEEDFAEWIVISVGEYTTTIRKRRGKKEMDIEGGKGTWEEVPDEEDESDDPADPIIFTQMFKNPKFGDKK